MRGKASRGEARGDKASEDKARGDAAGAGREEAISSRRLNWKRGAERERPGKTENRPVRGRRVGSEQVRVLRVLGKPFDRIGAGWARLEPRGADLPDRLKEQSVGDASAPEGRIHKGAVDDGDAARNRERYLRDPLSGRVGGIDAVLFMHKFHGDHLEGIVPDSGKKRKAGRAGRLLDYSTWGTATTPASVAEKT